MPSWFSFIPMFWNGLPPWNIAPGAVAVSGPCVGNRPFARSNCVFRSPITPSLSRLMALLVAFPVFSAVSEAPRATWLLNAACSLRKTRPATLNLNSSLSDFFMFASKSLRYVDIRFWPQTSGRFTTITPSSRIFSWIASIDRAICSGEFNRSGDALRRHGQSSPRARPTVARTMRPAIRPDLKCFRILDLTNGATRQSSPFVKPGS